MINASKEFKEKLKKGANLVNYADVTLSDGTVLQLTYKDFMIGGCNIEDKTTDGKFGVGFVIGKTLTIKIANHDERFSQYDFYNSIIRVYVAMLLDNGTIEKIRKGIYYVTVPSTTGEIIEINAVDGMFLLDKDYSVSNTAYPATLQTILSNACLDCGIPIGFQQFDNMNFVVSEKPEGVTYRQVVSYAAQIAGYNARIDNDGYMQLIWYNTNLIDSYTNYNGGEFKYYPHNTILDGGDFKNYGTGESVSGALFTDETPHHIFGFKELGIQTDDVMITGVRVLGENDSSFLFGEEGYLIEVSGNSLANGKEQEVADYLGKRLVGITFRPFSGQILNNPLYDPYDVCMISDSRGNVYYSYINSVSYTVGSYTQIACEAEDPIRNGSTYFSPSAQAVVKARRNTENQITDYDKAVQNMNQLAMNTLGFFETVEEAEDGSRITYMHDRPALEDSLTIYKRSINGFFISQDGGKSYAAGFDKNGNAVVNVLNAIGINADWINAGTLSGRKINNGSGTFQVDESGNCTANKFISNNASITGGTINISTANASYSAITLEYAYNKLRLSPNTVSISDYDAGNVITISSGIINGSRDVKSGSSLGEQTFRLNNAGDLYCIGSFLCMGTKSRSVKTQNYGERLLYCYETPSPIFGDIGEGQLDSTGICVIYLDDVFTETIDTDAQYQVFLQAYGDGSIYIKEREPSYFVVQGSPNLLFGWEIKAIQKDYDSIRLENPDNLKNPDAEENYTAETYQYLETLLYDPEKEDIS